MYVDPFCVVSSPSRLPNFSFYKYIHQKQKFRVIRTERLQHALDMAINTKKSSCVRIGPRNDNVCAKLTMCDGSELSWVDEIRYLGVFVTRSRKSKCSIDNAKRSFHRAANGIFGKVGRLASEEVVVT